MGKQCSNYQLDKVFVEKSSGDGKFDIILNREINQKRILLVSKYKDS
jgi:hypothetical protein